MSSRSTLTASASSYYSEPIPRSSTLPAPRPKPAARPSSSSSSWVDPLSLPHHGDVLDIAGNASDYVKQLTNNTFFAYAVGSADCFAYNIGKDVRFVEVSVDEKDGRRMEATTVAEVVVSSKMLNGAGMMHGGCIAYLIDNCAATPLVVLGLLQDTNGVGVTQSMNLFYHSPAPPGTCLRIVSTSVAFGKRVMSSRCEVMDRTSGRVIASACMSRMQPKL
ncbi:hypothetical protein PLICRDRAFT_51669 [Plicaturopsis crispa FD-325 SS-3]|nr:hypothetical protein PLICRDRAFT_51669 [Plicaturopsis crispa FD-325 SS-3]